MHFDVFTALTASTAVVFLLGIVFVFFWRRTPSATWLGLWAASYLVMAFANALAVIAPDEPKALGFSLGSAAFMLGFGLMWQAARVFEGRRPRWGLMFGAIFVFSSILLIPEIRHNIALRVTAVSTPMTLALALAAWETWRGRAEGLPSRTSLIVLLATVALIVGGRAVVGAQGAYPIGSHPVADFTIVVLLGGLIAAAILMAMFVLAMSLERREQSQRHLATTDPMTGLLNRRGLDAVYPDGALPAGAALIVFDLDQFKQVNDSFGHAAGDALIASFALICREELHHVDHAARFGGEEFVLVLARANAPAALALAEKVRNRYAQTVVPIEGGAVAGTVSGGVFAAPRGEQVWLTAAIAAADRAMYSAKTAGRNRVHVHEESDISSRGSSRGFDERCVAPDMQAASA